MPHATTIIRSGGGGRTRTLLQLVRQVLTELRLPSGPNDVPTIYADSDEGTDPDYVVEAVNQLNAGQQILYDLAGQSFGHSEAYWHLDDGVRGYDLPGDFLDMVSDPVCSLSPLDFRTIDAVDDAVGLLTDVANFGTPTEYSLFERKIQLARPPSSVYLLDKCCWHGGGWYICILPVADTAVIPDLDADHWERAVGAWNPHDTDPALVDADYAWNGDRSYYPGRLLLRYQAALTLMQYGAEVPLLPNPFYPAMVAYAVWQMAGGYCGYPATEVATKQYTYEKLEMIRIARRRPIHQNPRDRGPQTDKPPVGGDASWALKR